MVSNNTINSINTYSIVTPNTTLSSTPTKVLKKQRKTRCRKHLDTIKRTQSDTTASARFLLTALHSVSQAIIYAHTNKIAMYNSSDTSCFADSRASEDMFPD